MIVGRPRGSFSPIEHTHPAENAAGVSACAEGFGSVQRPWRRRTIPRWSINKTNRLVGTFIHQKKTPPLSFQTIQIIDQNGARPLHQLPALSVLGCADNPRLRGNDESSDVAR